MTEKAIGQRIADRFIARNRALHYIMLFFRVGFVIGGALAVALAQAFQIPAGASASLGQMVTIGGAALVALGGVAVLVLEPDASADISLAHEALVEVRNADTIQALLDLEQTSSRAVNLYYALMVIRRCFDSVIAGAEVDDNDFLKTLLDLCGQNLRVALGFEQQHIWTICIYTPIAGLAPGQLRFRCRAHDRAIHCDLASAKEWDEAGSVVGMAYRQNRVIAISDLNGPNIQKVLPPLLNAEKRERYRSIVAVPVTPDNQNAPWGVVVCTNNLTGHFDAENVRGFRPIEGVRAFALMLETMLSMRASLPKSAAPVPPPAAPHP